MSLAPARNKTPDHPAHSLATTPTMLPAHTPYITSTERCPWRCIRN